MAIQTEYKNQMDAGRLGGLVDMDSRDLISRVAEETIPFGCPLQVGDTAGTGEDAAVLKFNGGRFVGFSVRERSSINDEWVRGENVRVIHSQGAIWLEAAGAVAIGDQVSVTAGSTQVTNTGGTPISALFESAAAAAGDLVKVRLQAMIP